jgi:CubicO group peptidase (beta-lactamase class C family)
VPAAPAGDLAATGALAGADADALAGALAGAGRILEEAVTSGRVPGAVAAAGAGPRLLGSWVAGDADATPGARRPMQAGTVFDIASLTKVVATTTVTLALAGAGQLGLDDPVARYLPAAWPATIRQLLSHTAGLPPVVPFFRWCQDRDELLRALYAIVPQAPPGTRVAYSDLGFMALGEIVSLVAAEPLDALFRRVVASPLGMDSAGYIPLRAGAAGDALPDGPAAAAGRDAGFAATERDAAGKPWTGIVHDENARVMGGVAGHAGLFATVADLARFAAWWVSPAGGPVPAALRREAGTCQTARLDGRRGLGWACAGDRYDITGPAWPATAVSHTGFTGTSLALDPASGLWAVLLTNRVHFGRETSAEAIKSLRRDFHSAISRALPRALPRGGPPGGARGGSPGGPECAKGSTPA